MLGRASPPGSLALVLFARAMTTWLVASVVVPNIFVNHLQQAGDTHTATRKMAMRDGSAKPWNRQAVAVAVLVRSRRAVSPAASRRTPRRTGFN